jgi:hypothetical protein
MGSVEETMTAGGSIASLGSPEPLAVVSTMSGEAVSLAEQEPGENAATARR